MPLHRMHNPVQNYQWGSKTLFKQYLGFENKDEKPQAELWMGAHEKAPSQINEQGSLIPLNSYLEEKKESLPFLFKVLAVDQPLSIQAHPTKKQAEKGFAEEEKQGVPRTAGNRNYKDDNHKPELICAYTDFTALRGFRSNKEIAENFQNFQVQDYLLTDLQGLKNGGAKELKHFFKSLIDIEENGKKRLLNKVINYSNQHVTEPEAQLVLKLAEKYPGDIGIVSPYLLKMAVLQPGEAMYLPAGVLHCYISGLGVEIMANSDNVLRGGLTVKHVDKEELLSVLSFEEGDFPVIKPIDARDGRKIYRSEAPEFQLEKIGVLEDAPITIKTQGLQSIYLCMEGKLEIRSGDNKLTMSPGDSVYQSSEEKEVTFTGTGLVFRGTLPNTEKK
ncbi:MAG: mannose-6-phosphate isomerase, class I [Spirochaetia bacterium]